MGIACPRNSILAAWCGCVVEGHKGKIEREKGGGLRRGEVTFKAQVGGLGNAPGGERNRAKMSDRKRKVSGHLDSGAGDYCNGI